MSKRYRSHKVAERARAEACRCAATILADETWDGDESKRRLWGLCVFFESYIAKGAGATRQMMVGEEPKRLKAPVVRLITRDPA